MKRIAIISGLVIAWGASLAVCHELTNRETAKKLASEHAEPAARSVSTAVHDRANVTAREIQLLVRQELEHALPQRSSTTAASTQQSPASPETVTAAAIAPASAIVDDAMSEGHWSADHARQLTTELRDYSPSQRALARGRLMWAINHGKLRVTDPHAVLF
jgi:hypothetical protein